MSGEGRTWGARFDADMEQLTQQFTAGADTELWGLDIIGSISHARMLGATGIIGEDEAEQIVDGLLWVLEEFKAGRVTWRPELEDVHTHVEVLLRERIGETAGKLHTARSRNDQVALLNRLFVRDLCDRAVELTEQMIRALAAKAEEYAEVVMPGYTHLQRAQPVTLGHHLLAYAEMLLRDRDRFKDCRRRVNVMPLGSGALAGSPYPLDREMVARDLEFAGVSHNSLDATSDRDFVVEYLAAAALAQVHLSRFAEDLVLWSSAEFGFVQLPDGFATGSSMMPQKKNADVAELTRGRSGRAIGALVAMLTTIKGLPLAYNRDLQEDKTILLESASVLLPSLEIFRAMVLQLRFNAERMREAAGGGFSLATDVADYLVKKGMPFREAHAIVGRLVRACEARGCELNRLPLADYQAESSLFDRDVLAITVDTSVRDRDLVGGTAPRRVRDEVRRLLSGLP